MAQWSGVHEHHIQLTSFNTSVLSARDWVKYSVTSFCVLVVDKQEVLLVLCSMSTLYNDSPTVRVCPVQQAGISWTTCNTSDCVSLPAKCILQASPRAGGPQAPASC